MKKREITKDEIDALLKFLPKFSVPDRRFTDVEESGSCNGNIFAGPDYHSDVLEFFRLVAQDSWDDREYTSKEAARMVEDAEFIGRASLEEIKPMLTRCVRSERFCDGSWEALLSGGHIQNLLRRLQVLRDEM